MEYSDLLVSLIRWLHITAGLFFVGLNWWFNVVFIPFTMSTDQETRRRSSLELVPRGLYWFRWSALYTLIFGVLLLVFLFYMGGLTTEGQASWTTGTYVMVFVTFLSYRIYHLIVKTPVGKNLRLMGVIGLVYVAILALCMIDFGNFSYRAYVIHIGALFGLILVGNVWEKIWPGQRKIIEAIKAGNPADPAIMAEVGTYAQHNAYLSVPLLWTMIDAHTAVPAADSWLYLIGVIVVGWGIVALALKRGAKLKV
ncbi:MAG TPA: urate hydroxylase PuuD [Bacteroidota bacterium]|nr:urate hydroxylase PuuD [Bacteroidota bacterium]